LEEAEAALQQALVKDPTNADIVANSIVLNVIAGKDAKELITYGFPIIENSHANLCSQLSSAAPDHAFLTDLQEKSALFDKAATKYSAKVA